MMVSRLSKYRISILLVGVSLLLLAGCRAPAAPAKVSATVIPPTAAVSSTPEPPTSTPPPLAARVDNELIFLEDYTAEMTRYQAAHPNDSATPDVQRQAVLDDMVNQVLLAEGAAAGGYKVDDAALQSRLDALAAQAGGVPALQDWMKRNQYTDESFRRSLRLSMLAAWQRDQIIATVPKTAEQVHARQILVQDANQADDLAQRLKGGMNFAVLALQFDPATGGELGWFPKGYLTQPEVEQAAFALQPNEISPVVHSAIGYHIIQVIERDPQRALDTDARRVLQESALRDWLQQHRSQSKIELLVK